MPRNRLVLFIGILRPWKQRNIELIGHFEAELLGKDWAIWCVSLCTWHVSDKSFPRKFNISQGTGWHSSLIYLDHGNKETLN
jgi:aspartyl/asparaginyl beta-hydroxylase (cupin superfamily)